MRKNEQSPMNAMTVALPEPVDTNPDVQSPAVGRKLLLLEKQITKHYESKRRKIQPSYRVRSTEEAFMRAAELVHAHGADPFEFVDAQFSLNTFGGYPPPNHVGAESSVERWRKYREQREETLSKSMNPGSGSTTGDKKFSAHVEGLVSCQKMYVYNMRSKSNMTDEEIFLGKGSPLRAWYRVAFAPEELRSEVEKKYGQSATDQLRGEESLSRYLDHLTGRTTLTTPGVKKIESKENASIRTVRQNIQGKTSNSSDASSRIIPFPGGGV